jgi:hypothetical protein
LKHLRAVLRRIANRLERARQTIRERIAQLRRARRLRNSRKHDRRVAERIRDNKQLELRRLINKGREESDRAMKLAEQIGHLDRRIANLRHAQKGLTERVTHIRHTVEEAERHRGKLEDARRRINRRIQEIHEEHNNQQTGTGAWGGSMSIVEQEVVPIMTKYGPITSRKRTETFGNPSSDHYVGNTTAYAADCGIAERHDVLDEIGRALGIGPMTDYASYYITRSGNRFRVQGIAGTHGTGPHLHLGVRRA